MKQSPKITIIGAGIGGLSLALMLHQRGFPFEVYEAVESVKALGVGINVQPSAVAELFALGLSAPLDTSGVQTREISYFNPQGQRVWTEARGMFAGYPVPQFSIHRGRLQQILLRALEHRAGCDVLRLGRRVIGFSLESQSLTLQHQSNIETVKADLVVAADGIHSSLRKQFFPEEGAPRFSGRMLWRATSLAAPFLSGATMAMIGHSDQKFVTYPIEVPNAETGLQRINWIAELRVDEAEPSREDWNKQVPKSVFAEPFKDWQFDWLDIPALIHDASACYEFPMVDRDPLPYWGKGACTLLGDAAHPMYPIGSNGASQAILDAKSLCDHLIACEGDPIEAFRAYEDERRPLTAAIVMANRGQGPDHCLELVRQRAPDGFSALDDIVSEQELVDIAARYKSLVGLEIERIQRRVQSDAELLRHIEAIKHLRSDPDLQSLVT